MKRLFAITAGIAFLCCLASAQDASLQFEAADVHVSPPGATQSGGFLPGRVEFRAMPLLRLISIAWGVPVEQINGGPNWIDTDLFDVVAKGPVSESQAGMQTMLRNLLAERFGLVVETVKKPMPVFALVPSSAGAGKRAIPKEAIAGDPSCKRATEENLITLTCRNTTIASLAGSLRTTAPAYFTRPVVDLSGLTGAYDFKLEWVGRGQLPAGPEGDKSPQSLYTSIEKQLGIHVEPRDSPIDSLSIAHVNRIPSENPPGVMEKLGPPPSEFEVASLVPSRPDEKEDFKMQNGRVDAQAIALRDLIQFAWNAEDDALKGGEKWLDTEKFDIVAKTAPTASEDTLRLMLRSLLAERFKLKVHDDRQPVTVYALTAPKAKLRDADPAARTGCAMSRANGLLSYICQNVTMAQFADKIREVAPRVHRSPRG